MSVELMVNQWIEAAHERGASDIHFEPLDKDDRLRVRVRVDGELRGIETVNDGRKVIARLKVMAGLDVNERGVPLDGRIKFSPSGGGRGGLDLRLSTTPCMGGEKAVLRLIDSSRLGLSLEDLGYTKRMLDLYRPHTQAPYGLLLHVGPTGSGKTTSLYAVLTSLNRTEVNIQTVEDPVEYDVAGITQTQVSHDLGLTFPKVLRALLRQDPNVILVGEIRDPETAEIALEASMTGHLVLSTLHANEAVGALIRLIDMGMTPYSIAYALRCVIAQRFARRLCEQCRKKVAPPEALARLVGNRPLYTGEGCKACQRTGFAGRIPLYEYMPMSDALKKSVYGETTPDALQAVASRSGMITMFEDGVEKAGAGLTTLEEVLRLTRGLRTSPRSTAHRRPTTAMPSGAAPRPAAPRPAAPVRQTGAMPRPTSQSDVVPGVRPAPTRPGAPRPPRPPGVR
ncbi:MAG: GspE/PulE family protein [Planctomycetes bacterium]|nr:GspE/PulE family protein [Planctomycetota bacterium]